MNVDIELMQDACIHQRVIREELPAVQRSVLIVSALMKQTSVKNKQGHFVPFLAILDDLLARGASVSLLFAGRPSLPFLQSLGEYPRVMREARARICARNDMKLVLLDGGLASQRLYLGSANLTGAGLGSQGSSRRNFEFGLLTQDPALVDWVSAMVAPIWTFQTCKNCRAKRLCQREHDAYRLFFGRSGIMGIDWMEP